MSAAWVFVLLVAAVCGAGFAAFEVRDARRNARRFAAEVRRLNYELLDAYMVDLSAQQRRTAMTRTHIKLQVLVADQQELLREYRQHCERSLNPGSSIAAPAALQPLLQVTSAPCDPPAA